MSDDPDKPWRLPNAKRMTFNDMAARAQYERQRAEDAEAEVKHQADRIEELEAQITAIEEGLTAVRMAGYIDGKRAAKAKLAKAKDFVRRTIRYARNSGDDFLADKARTTLTELTRGKDE